VQSHKKLTDVSAVLTAAFIQAITVITLMMEAVNISETSIIFYEATRRNIAEGCRTDIPMVVSKLNVQASRIFPWTCPN
jgi:hypothetical protein